MGIDCCDVRQIIHVGPPEDVESYIQHIGRCGRDDMPARAVMLYGKKLMEKTSSNLIKYCTISVCRQDFLFYDFECYIRLVWFMDVSVVTFVESLVCVLHVILNEIFITI